MINRASDLELMIVVVYKCFRNYGVEPELTSHLYANGIVRTGSHATGRSFDFAPRPREYEKLSVISKEIHDALTALGVKHLGRIESGHIHITLTSV